MILSSQRNHTIWIHWYHPHTTDIFISSWSHTILHCITQRWKSLIWPWYQDNTQKITPTLLILLKSYWFSDKKVWYHSRFMLTTPLALVCCSSYQTAISATPLSYHMDSCKVLAGQHRSLSTGQILDETTGWCPVNKAVLSFYFVLLVLINIQFPREALAVFVVVTQQTCFSFPWVLQESFLTWTAAVAVLNKTVDKLE